MQATDRGPESSSLALAGTANQKQMSAGRPTENQGLVSAGPSTRNWKQVSAGLPTEDQAGLVAVLWYWVAESLGVVEVADDVGSHVSLCGLHGTP